MSVTAPQGFKAAGVAAGIKASGNPDVAVVINEGPSAAAAGAKEEGCAGDCRSAQPQRAFNFALLHLHCDRMFSHGA